LVSTRRGKGFGDISSILLGLYFESFFHNAMYLSLSMPMNMSRVDPLQKMQIIDGSQQLALNSFQMLWEFVNLNLFSCQLGKYLYLAITYPSRV